MSASLKSEHEKHTAEGLSVRLGAATEARVVVQIEKRLV